MRPVLAASSVALAIVSVVDVAGAQKIAAPASTAGSKYKQQPLILQHEQLGTGAMADVGHARMRAGDCAGALDAFDAALRTAVDPTINRDRGICHERLGHAYPAIDDYRVYLTAQPDAPDSDGIRQRLVRLEQETLGRSSASSDLPEDVATADVSAGAAARTSNAPTPGTGSRDKMDYVDRDDDAQWRSPFRWDKGWTFSPFFAEHKWLGAGTSFGDSSTWSESVGLQLRYSFGRAGALFVEAGYEYFNTTALDPATITGLTSQLGYEFRFPLDGDRDNQLFLAPGIGYQHAIVSPTDPQFQTETVGAIVPRVRLGYRHMIAAAVALDVGIDGGWSKYFEYGGAPAGGAGPTTKELLSSSALAALGVAVGWGL